MSRVIIVGSINQDVTVTVDLAQVGDVHAVRRQIRTQALA